MRRAFVCMFFGGMLLFGAKKHDSIGPGDTTIPVIIVGGEWSTVIVFNNTNDAAVKFPVDFLNQDGPWELPVKDSGTSSRFTISLAAKGSTKIEIDYQSSITAVGYAMITPPGCTSGEDSVCAGVGVYALLRNHNAARKQDFEVSYQLANGFAASPQQFIFDQSNFAQMVLNLTNPCVQFCRGVTVTLEIFDEQGQQFYVDAIDLGAGEVKILNIAQLSSATWNRIGMVRVSGDGVIITGHRINETGSFTPLISYTYNQ